MDAVDFNCTHRPGDRALETRGDYVKLLCDNSPPFKAICRLIRDYVLCGEALLLIDQVPLNAWHYEIAIKLLLVPVATMHAGLDQSARTQLMDDFNNGRLDILIIMYEVGVQAINLQKRCHRPLLLGQPKTRCGSPRGIHARLPFVLAPIQ